MSPAQPDDQDDPRGGSADVAAAFDQIVAGLRAEGDLPAWPEERAAAARPPRPDPPSPDTARTESPEPQRPESERPALQRPDQPYPDAQHPGPQHLDTQRPDQPYPDTGRAAPVPEDDHFIPPDPPPLPPLGQAAAVGVALLALGVLLVVAPDLLGLSEAAGLTLGLITLAGGLGWLVLRSWSTDPPDDADPVDDGARF